MKGRIGQRAFYAGLRGALGEAMAEWSAPTGRRYGLIDAYRTEDAELDRRRMGTIADTAAAVVDHLRRQGGGSAPSPSRPSGRSPPRRSRTHSATRDGGGGHRTDRRAGRRTTIR